MIPYIVGKLAPNLTHFTRGMVKLVPGRGCFRAVPSTKGDKIVTSSPPPPIVERLINMDQPRKVAKPGRGQLNREIECPYRCIRGKYICNAVCCLDSHLLPLF